MYQNFADIRAKAQAIGNGKVAVAAANDSSVLGAVIEARKTGIANSILVGSRTAIEKILADLGETEIDKYEIIDEPNDAKAAQIAVKLVREGQANVLLKGQLKTALLLKAALDAETGLRSGSLLSDCLVFHTEQNGAEKLCMLTDGGVNLYPELDKKAEIVKNAIRLAHALDIEKPRVALLAAVEVVNPKMPETLDAAIIAKMADRGQIRGAFVDGPLALDNAVSLEAAKAKKIESQVAGQADVLVVPNIAAGNIFGKSLTYQANLEKGHLIMGAAAPIIITSRTDVQQPKVNSIALGVVYSHFYQK